MSIWQEFKNISCPYRWFPLFSDTPLWHSNDLVVFFFLWGRACNKQRENGSITCRWIWSTSPLHCYLVFMSLLLGSESVLTLLLSDVTFYNFLSRNSSSKTSETCFLFHLNPCKWKYANLRFIWKWNLD